jgi:hypothetical protein
MPTDPTLIGIGILFRGSPRCTHYSSWNYPPHTDLPGILILFHTPRTILVSFVCQLRRLITSVVHSSTPEKGCDEPFP